MGSNGEPKSIWCHRGKHRLIIMPGRSKNGTQYLYFICRGRQDRTCDLPYMAVLDVEAAIADHYATLTLPTDLHKRITASLDATLADNAVTSDTLRIEIKKHLAKIDAQQDQFLDLVGDPDWPREKIAKRLRGIRDDRARLEAQLSRGGLPPAKGTREGGRRDPVRQRLSGPGRGDLRRRPPRRDGTSPTRWRTGWAGRAG
ncbi:hypothetical protein GCM10010404_73750 [Nonomuraea africana]